MGCGPSIEAVRQQPTDVMVATGPVKDPSVNMSAHAEKYLESFTILFVGAGDSGKSTLRKQVSNIYESTFRSPDFRKSFATIIVGNLLDGTLQVLTHMDAHDVEVFDMLKEEAREGKDYISAWAAKTIFSLYTENPKFRQTIKVRGSEVQLADNYHDFCKRLREYPVWGGQGWIPNVDDCVRARARTTGVAKVDLVIDKRKFTIVDVGGQRAERRKWLNNTANVRSVDLVVFVASLSEYDQRLFEERSKNRLEESLDLFSECINSDWLKDRPAVLYLNKKDVFDRKFKKEKIPLNVSGRFPDAPSGDSVDSAQAITWIVSKYAKRRKCNQRLSAFVMSATSPDRVKTVFDQCCDMLIKREFLIQGSNARSTHISEGSASNVSSQSLY